MFDLTGRVAVVTGASRGLGRQDALTLAGMGADVVITDVLVEEDPNQSYELWDRDVKVNLTGAFNCTREVWPYLVENKWGRLIFMSSVAGTLGGFGQASYSSTKAGLIGLAKTAALEGGRHNITSN